CHRRDLHGGAESRDESGPPVSDRRSVLRLLGGAMVAVTSAGSAPAEPSTRPRIAAVVTEYRENSHADVIVTKFLEGCRTAEVDYQPGVEIASLYLDQVPANDIGREMAARHKVPVFQTIEGALTLG